ncbi:MAG: type I secretion system permease/ATPase [Paracoccaceae bacterium]
MRPRENAYSSAMSRMRRTFIVVAVFSAVVNVLMLTGPMFMLQVYDRVLSSGSVATLQGLFVIVVVLYGFLGLYDFLRTRLLSRATIRLDQAVGRDVFRAWMRSGLAGSSDFTRPLNDLAILRGFLSSPAMLGLFDAPWIPFYLAVVWLVHPWLGMLALAGVGVVVSLALLNQATTRRHFARAMSMDASESFFVEQARRTADAILPLGMADRVMGRWQAMHAQGLATSQVGSDRAEGFTAGSKAFRLLLQSALLGLGGYLALKQEISPGMIIAASIISGRALAPVDQVIGQWRNLVRAREAHKRLKQMFADLPAPSQTVNLPDPQGQLLVRNLTKYAPNQKNTADAPPILDEVTFGLQPGDAVGVIGPSASGKSTLARLLTGAWAPDSGEVRLDGATLDQWPPEALGRHIGYLPQNLELLAGTIRDNIARFDPDTQDEDVIAAAKLAGVHDMILGLPDGYATQLGFEADGLSGGQIQRIGLARAVYGIPKYVVLDEPNSNLDAAGDDALSYAIMSLREAGSTVVVMAHRPSAIAAVNKVLVLHGGQVAEFGPKDDVLQRMSRPQAKKPAPEPAKAAAKGVQK